MSARFEQVAVGEAIPELVKPPIDRTQLALYAAASGDHNPIHLDDERAKAGGLPGAIVHGMLMGAFLGQTLTNWVPQTAIRSLSIRFAAPALPGDSITCRGVVKAKTQQDGQNLVELELTAVNQRGETKLTGTASIALP
jgi:acyl dehydratase